MRMVLLALALTAAAAPAFPEPPKSREQALNALKNQDAATRAEAVVWIANRGAAADEGLLHERLRDESAFVRSYAEQGLWLLWSRSGDAELDALMARGVEEMQAGRHVEAIATFSSVISRKPDFAEAWNKRATVHYLAGDYHKSLADCDEALAWFRRALDVNPNMVGVEINIRGLEQLLKQKRGRST